MVVTIHNVFLETYLGYKARFYWSSPFAYLLNSVVVPVFMMLGFGFMASFVLDPALTQHVVIGMSVNGAVLFLATAVMNGFYGEKWTGTLPIIFLPSGNRMVHYYTRGLGHYPNALFTIAIGLLAGGLILGVDYSAVNWEPFLVSIILIVTSIIMFMLFMGDIVILLRDWQNLYMAALGITAGLTGVVVPVSSLPSVFEAIAQILPISHGLVALRDCLSGAGFGDVKDSLLLEAAVSLGYALMGYVGFLFAERELKRRGLMDQQGI